MSVDIEVPFSSPPLKRPRKITSLFGGDVSKCGEIFVTNNAEKWSYLCGYCQGVTNDIGVFICHIRLEHLNLHTDSAQQQQIQQNPEAESNVSLTASSSQGDENLIGFMPTIQIADALTTEELQPQSKIVKQGPMASTHEGFEATCFKASKIVDMASTTQPENDDMRNFNDNKNFFATPHHTSEENYENVFTITSINSEAETQELSSETDNKEVVTVVKVENGAADETKHVANTEIIKKEQDVDDDDDDDGKISSYSPSEDDEDSDDTDFEINNGSKPSGSSKAEKDSSSTDSELPRHNCPYCPKRSRNKNTIHLHILRHHHNKLTIKCEKCNRGFYSKQGLNLHLKSNCENVILSCPVCGAEHSDKTNFILHVLTHESDTCFPCQVCGKLYDSNEERIEHWETHAEEKPFHCPICYRRFLSYGMLERHLRTHGQYRCSVCAAEFKTTKKQQPPYVCMACGKSETDSNEETITKGEYGSDGAASKQIVEDITNDDSNTQSSYTQDDPNLEFIDASGSGNAKTSATLRTKTTAKVDDKFLHGEKDEGSVKYKCELCDKSYKTSSGLSTHKRDHKETKIFQCPLCPKTVNKEVHFVDHVLRHENESCFPCQVCGKLFGTNAERVKHWETHTAEKPYGCDICFRRYRQMSILNSHMKTHGLR